MRNFWEAWDLKPFGEIFNKSLNDADEHSARDVLENKFKVEPIFLKFMDLNKNLNLETAYSETLDSSLLNFDCPDTLSLFNYYGEMIKGFTIDEDREIRYIDIGCGDSGHGRYCYGVAGADKNRVLFLDDDDMQEDSYGAIRGPGVYPIADNFQQFCRHVNLRILRWEQAEKAG